MTYWFQVIFSSSTLFVFIGICVLLICMEKYNTQFRTWEIKQAKRLGRLLAKNKRIKAWAKTVKYESFSDSEEVVLPTNYKDWK